MEKNTIPTYFEIENAKILYSFNKENNCYVIEQMDSFKKEQGKALIKAFAKEVGPNKLVQFEMIIEEETVKTLAKQGVLQHVENTGISLEITNPSLFKSLKITNVIRGGGMTIEKMVLTPFLNPDDEDRESNDYLVYINIYART